MNMHVHVLYQSIQKGILGHITTECKCYVNYILRERKQFIFFTYHTLNHDNSVIIISFLIIQMFNA